MLFERPFDVSSYGDGQIVVSEPNLNRIKKINLIKTEISFAKQKNGELYRFGLPLGVCYDSGGFLYVADSLNRKIVVLNPQMLIEKEWSGDLFFRPVSLAIDEERRRVYVVEPDQHKVLVLDKADGEFKWAFGERGDGDGQFNFPTDIDVDTDGNIYVLDSLNARVQVFGPDGNFLRKFGERGTAVGSFRIPKGLAVSPNGIVYVSDSLSHRVVVFDLQGDYLLTIGGQASAEVEGFVPGGFYLPQGIDVDGMGQIWVVDALGNAIHRFQYLTDEYLDEHPILPGQAVKPLK